MNDVRAVTLSPIFLDQAFPRNENELRVVASSLGDLIEDLEAGTVLLMVPEVFEEFLDLSLYSWQQKPAIDSWLRDIATHLFQILNQLAKSVIRLRVDVVNGRPPHPVPGGVASELTDEWAVQMAGLLEKHDAAIAGNRYFIGIACPYKYAGLEDGGYTPPLPIRYFPLVSARTARAQLMPYHSYDAPINLKSQRLTYRHVRQNFKFIGGIELKDVSGSDHQRLHFGGGRWVEFDTGGKRDSTLIPDAWMKQVCAKLDLPDEAADAVKAALIAGCPMSQFEHPRFSGANTAASAD
jgi:hypothetical protein